MRGERGEVREDGMRRVLENIDSALSVVRSTKVTTVQQKMDLKIFSLVIFSEHSTFSPRM